MESIDMLSGNYLQIEEDAIVNQCILKKHGKWVLSYSDNLKFILLNFSKL